MSLSLIYLIRTTVQKLDKGQNMLLKCVYKIVLYTSNVP